ncbi:DUF5959 family protein [Kitasatospora viridis]|uniref:Uncharacterized protein n=1 Tax=Kitasatospora viridis TaxID=281105 RepID=A0A561SE80_9ACTN|nr:DUF5959 family protein [Kitasatospora viridis]TWF73145.1 hypothetical protein FHX73_16296 [Kitasatospora viridis]
MSTEPVRRESHPRDLRAPVELLHLADRENSVVIRILGRHSAQELDGEVVIASTFCNGRLPLRLSARDLDDWARALDELARGRDVCWLTDLRNPEIGVEFDTQFAVPLVTVEDVRGSGTAMAVPVELPEGWIDEQRRRLDGVRRL